MTTGAKVPDDEEAARGRVRDLIHKAFSRNVLGHDARAEFSKEVSERFDAPADVAPVPAQKKAPSGAAVDVGGADNDTEGSGSPCRQRLEEVLRQKHLVGDLREWMVRHARTYSISEAGTEDVVQDVMEKAVGCIERGPLVIEDDREVARRQMTAYLKRLMRTAVADHYRKVGRRSAALAGYKAKVGVPKEASAEEAFIGTADESMAVSLTEGFSTSMDEAVAEAERFAAALHGLVTPKQMMALIMHKAFAVRAEIVAEMIGSTKNGVRMACVAAGAKLSVAPAKRTFLMRLGRADAE
ncbi:RNA polymerase sigma factor [Streptomyces sp. NPDC097617]|uniref:RNA polymerase sigma factor n=1 Tax=Streptomyces sp. NPDC097617 TaxID=3366091 RepID=UPI0037F7EE3C